jgi:aspartyl-tRNA(Asn)/glutamyl-tRNA(Gln) amidotransferase subunit C
MSAKITIEDVGRVAELAHLKLAPDEVGPMLRDLNAILAYIAELNELDTSNVLPLDQVSELEIGKGSDVVPALRADQLVPSLNRAAVMAEAPETDGVFFKVPKVIER